MPSLSATSAWQTSSPYRQKEKCIVMCSRRTGCKTLLNLLDEAGNGSGLGVVDLSMRADFDDKGNKRGQRYHWLVADADAGSESIEFKCVRHHILVDVPERHLDYIQRCGRSAPITTRMSRKPSAK